MRPTRRHSFLATLCVAFFACGGEDRVPISPSGVSPLPSNVRPAAIVILSGDHQQGKANERLAEPFVVQARDAHGKGLPQVNVRFRVTSGDGAWRWDENGAVTTSVVPTDSNGRASAFFTPLVLGNTTVKADVVGRKETSVTFSTNATVQVIYFVLWGWGLFDEPDVTVPVGTPVEWKQTYSRSNYTVISTATPSGGPSFDSGILGADEQFEFVPRVAGTWEYFDRLSGAKGTLTAR